MRRRWLGAGAVLLCVTTLGACSSGQDGQDQASPYAAQIKAAARTAQNSFERSVLQDGKITRVEYVDAVNRFLACAKAHGLTLSAVDHGGVFTYEGDGLQARNGDVFDSCSEGTTIQIESLYREQVTNPDHRDPVVIRVECFVATGLAPRGYTAADFKTDSNPPGGGNAKYPFSDGDPRFVACMQNPQAAVSGT